MTVFAEVGSCIILTCVFASSGVFDNSFSDLASYVMDCFEIETSVEPCELLG